MHCIYCDLRMYYTAICDVFDLISTFLRFIRFANAAICALPPVVLSHASMPPGYAMQPTKPERQQLKRYPNQGDSPIQRL
jgi:hypothetical protein